MSKTTTTTIHAQFATSIYTVLANKDITYPAFVQIYHLPMTGSTLFRYFFFRVILRLPTEVAIRFVNQLIGTCSRAIFTLGCNHFREAKKILIIKVSAPLPSLRIVHPQVLAVLNFLFHVSPLGHVPPFFVLWYVPET
jgi:hypothetical protein